jgi:1-deoxy-D-xylulose-5-phosphate synthase
MKNMSLDNIKKSSDLRDMTIEELELLASEIGNYLISTISATGGHIGANLGVVELTIALHSFFDIEREPLVFDVGHQGYTHKLLTGRKHAFKSLNQFGGMSRFLTRSESPHDILDASHGGTSISTASGMAYSNLMSGSSDVVVAIIGDGSLVEGMAFEGLNYAAQERLPLIIVINDNGMAIAPNVGGIKNLFSGDDWISKSRGWFEGMGFAYQPVSNGHNIGEIRTALSEARKQVEEKPVIVHVKTEKGRGLALAKNHPYKLHFSMPFDADSGQGISATPIGESYQTIVGEVLSEFMSRSEGVYALTPATPYASGIEELMKKFPDRTIDVGMAEQHAVGMAAGLAIKGKSVFACFQATFMQRAIDQIFHDICYPQIPITIVSARSGFSGYDGPTHHGIYDFGFLRTLPNIKIFYAGTKRDLRAILEERYQNANGPMIVLHPYELISPSQDQYLPEKITPLDLMECVEEGTDGVIIALGNRLSDAIDLKRMVFKKKKQNYAVYNLRWVNPLPIGDLRILLSKYNKVITLEEAVRNGGIGCAINEFARSEKIACQIYVSAIDDGFLPAGDKQELSVLANIDIDTVFAQSEKFWC